jgi:hypothetical protein
VRQHLAAALFFTALALVWSYPLARHLSTHMPGALGDNEQFLWNFWWMRKALVSGADFFHSPYLLAPVGADLTLHTHTALAAFAGATVLGGLPVVAAMNVTTIASLALNGFIAYLLAWRMTAHRGAALLGGTLFATCPYVAAHLNGHYDLVMVWTIALFALVAPRAIGGSVGWAAVAGLVLGLTAYVSSYYLVYDAALVLCFTGVAARRWSATLRTDHRYSKPWLTAAAIALALDAIALAVIFATGGLVARIGPLRLSMRDPFNALEIFWLLLLAALWIRYRPAVASAPRDGWSARRTATALATMAGVFVIVAAPLVRNGVQLIARGEYVTQTYFWRSAPVGIDAATLILGNPFHGVWGDFVRRAYERLGIDVIESAAWLGIVPVWLAVYAIRRSGSNRGVRQWTVVLIVFGLWTLGSLVHVAGQNIAMIGPAFVLRYVPIVENARMPGRAMAVVYLALALLAAAGAARWTSNAARPGVVMLTVGVIAFADFLAAPFPLARVDCPSIYYVLRDRPERGTLAELPLGIGDGFGPVTPIEPRALLCQTVHERPMLGGVISRLPARLLTRYSADPLLGAWLRLSGARTTVEGADAPLPGPELAAERMAANDIAFVILHRDSAAPPLREYVEHGLPLTPVAEDGDRVLYVKTPR